MPIQTALALLLILNAILLTTAAAQTFTVTVDDGRHTGSGSSNPANGGVFAAHANDGIVVDGIQSDNLATITENVATSAVTFTAEFVDDSLGLGLTGLKIQYDVTISAFRFDGADTVAGLIDEASGHLGIRGGSNNSTIDSAAGIDNGEEFEFIRASIGNVSVVADPNGALGGGETIAVDGFVGPTIRVGSSDGAEKGSVYIAGTTDVGTTALASFDGTSFRQYLTWETAALEVDSYPDTAPTNGDQGIDLQGFKAQFSIVSDPGSLDGLRMTDVTFDGTTATATWNSRANQPYFVYFSTDLVNWEELDDSFASQGESTTYTDDLATRFGALEPPQPVPANGFYRAEENNNG